MLIDTTLREGEQLFGVYFDLETRQRILAGLLAVGVEEIEAGWVGRDDLPALMSWARERKQKTALGVWSPARLADVERAADLEPDRINLGAPVSDDHLRLRLRLSRKALRTRLGECVRAAKDAGIPYVSVGMEDACRADREFIRDLACELADLGADRVRLADTVGLLTPLEIRDMVRELARVVTCDIAVHCHDDFGMAAANALAGLEAGAAYADVSVLGLGERAGIAPLEAVAGFMRMRRGVNRYDLTGLQNLCGLVSKASGVPLSPMRPLVGESLFSCESGLHVHGLLEEPELYEPYAPSQINRERELALGAKSGRAAIKAMAWSLGMAFPDDALSVLTRAVRELSTNLGRPLDNEEFLALLDSERA